MALVNVPNGIMWPAFTMGMDAAKSVTAVTMNDTTDKIAWVLESPVTGALQSIALYTGTITDADTLIVRLETLAADGTPTGTLIDSPTNAAAGTVAIGAGDDNVSKICDINGGTGVTVTLGVPFAIVLALTTGAKTQGYRSYVSTGYVGFPYALDYNVTAGTTWTKFAGSPCVALKIGGVWVNPRGCNCMGSGIEDAIATPKERGMEVYLPFAAKAIGFVMSIKAATGGNMTARLYSDPEGTPDLVVDSASIDCDLFQTLGAARYWIGYFDTEVTLDINTSYALVIAPDATTLSTWYHVTPGGATTAASLPGGAHNRYYSRDDSAAGAFTPDAAKWPEMWIILSALGDIAVPDFPAVGNVTEDDTVNGATGTYHEATVAEVQDGVMFGAASALEGEYAPAADYPSEDDVRDAVDYAGATMTGNMTLPDVADVRDGTTYGTDGTELEGELVVGGGSGRPEIRGGNL